MLAPVIVFAYNRPWHLEQTLISLKNNELAEDSMLFIYCDGPKNGADEEQLSRIKAVRQVAAKEQWCGEVRIVESPVNKGLGNSIIGAVTDIIEEYGKVIVVEDDLVLSPYFLRYMNAALDFYEPRKSVFSIGASRPPLSKMSIPADYGYDVFVSLRSCSWGWATWKDRWSQVDWSMSYYESFRKDKNLIEAFGRCGDDVLDLLEMQNAGKIDSWSIRFGFAHFANHAITILPCVPFVNNIGCDGSGTHCGKAMGGGDIIAPNGSWPLHFLDTLYEDSRIINLFANTFSREKRPLWKRGINYLMRLLNKKPVFVIKKKIYA